MTISRAEALAALGRATLGGLWLTSLVACTRTPPPQLPAKAIAAEPVAVAAPPPAPAPLPFRLPCGDNDLEGCQKGCDDHQREDCVTLATMYLKGNGVVADKDRALGMLRVACNDESARGCMRLGDAYKEGAVADLTEETGFYKKACDAGANQGCVATGKAYLIGRGVGLDPSFAATLFSKVCARGNAEACVELARQYQHGDGVKKNEEKAKDLFDKACKLGLDLGCVSASKNPDVLSPRE